MDAVIYAGEPKELRAPCKRCGSTTGNIQTKPPVPGGQDCVYCDCGAFQYNAPKTETGRKQRSVQTTHEAIKPNQRARIILRANGRCELCGVGADVARLDVGHLLSVDDGHKQGYPDELINSDENLAAMCDQCNLGLGKQTLPLRLAFAIFMAHAERNVKDED